MAVRRAVGDALDDVRPGSSVLVACSGGPDSLALMGASAWVGARRGLAMRAVVVDHGLQPGSGETADWAARTCLALGAASAEVVAVEVTGSGGPEAAARSARFAALDSAASRWAAPGVLLGHTREDQAETVLLRLARGSGARSLSAMQPRVGLWRRPLLDLARADVHSAAVELLEPLGETAWRDPHNADRGFARVRVRELLASLSDDLGPGVVLGLARTARLLRDDAEALDAWSEREYRDAVVDSPAGVMCDVAALQGLPRAVRTRLIRLMCLRRGCPPDQLDFDHVTRVEALVCDWHGQGAISLPGGVEALRACGRLCVREHWRGPSTTTIAQTGASSGS